MILKLENFNQIHLPFDICEVTMK